MDIITFVFVVAVIGFLYFAPTLAAVALKNPQAGAIMVLNMFLGWTLLGWVIALVWALIVPTERKST